MLFPILLPPQAPVAAAAEVQAFGLYTDAAFQPSNEAAFRTGTMVVVRRKQTDGSTTTDVRTLPVIGHTMTLNAVGNGRIVRDADGRVTHIELMARTIGPFSGQEGSGAWDRSKEEDGVLKGWTQGTDIPRRSTILPDEGFYSLGAVEALTYNPEIASWRVPAADGTGPVTGTLYGTPGGSLREYTLSTGSSGRYWYRGEAVDLRVRPVILTGDAPRMATFNHQQVVTQYAAVALFDASGRLVGYGAQNGKMTDMDNQAWSGKSEPWVGRPKLPTAPSPFDGLIVSSWAAPITLSPAERAKVLADLPPLIE